ncbi:MAG: Fis family transcriptional regulator [Desulfobacteraceae bacterium 4572_130]|nr:MAG: Fis family transcriptional regulator [Desulfobacteraceae bacterium 4572_130]
MYPTVLIVDDEKSIIESLEGILSDDGFEVLHAFNGYEAMKKIEAESPDIVLLDIWMPGMDGIETLKEIKKNFPSIPVVMITGHGTIESAVEATKSGAFDFLEKPLSINRIMVTINNALNFRRLKEQNKYLRKKNIEKYSISGSSQAVKELNKQIIKAAPTDASILISGENGTGKELIAKTIHQFSFRAEEPFIIVNCAAISGESIESELFGHEKGAFPRASAKNKGKFELASKGTLFLDEIGDMNLETQSKILRALETKTFQRIGGGRILQVDVRIIAATNKDIEQEINNGNFRKDLFYRLNVIPIKMPSLKKRKEDIPILVESFLAACSKKTKNIQKEIEKDALKLLMNYDWQGNIRELKNLIERLSIMVKEDTLKREHIPYPYDSAKNNIFGHKENYLFSLENFNKAKIEFEKEFLRNKVKQENGNVDIAAEKIGIVPSYISEILKES